MEQTQSSAQKPQPYATVSAGEALAPPTPTRIGGGDLMDPDEVSPAALAELEARAEFFQKALRMAFLQTEPEEYVIHKSEDGKTSTVYPMGRAATALLKFFGMKFAAPVPILNATGAVVGYQPGPQECLVESVEVQQETRSGGSRVVRYVCVTSALWMSSGRCIALTEGKRAIGTGYSKDAVEARQCAVQNMASRAARLVLGLGITPDWFTARGVDLSKAKVVEFQDRKGSVSADPREATLPFGQAKGTKVADASDADLQWILPKIRDSVADPEKARFKKSNEALATAIQAELDKRAAKPTEDLQQAEEMERLLIAIREEAAVARVPEAQLEAHLKTLDTVPKLEASLDYYRKRRAARAAKAASSAEPGSAG